MGANAVVSGATNYKGMFAQQHENAFDTFRKFLAQVKPKRILEIGTAGGGFTLFLREYLNEIGLQDSYIKSFDIKDTQPYEDRLRCLNNIEVNIENMFDKTYQLLIKPELVKEYIQSDGLTLVLCDGGKKKVEFRAIAHLIKDGDIIMAHDYVDTWKNFEAHFKGKIWNWREIGYEHIERTCNELNLKPFFKEEMAQVVWACFRKEPV